MTTLGNDYPDPISLLEQYKQTVLYFSKIPQMRPAIIEPRTLRNWFTAFCSERMFWVRLIENDFHNVVKLPPLLDKFPELVEEINSYMQANIGDMSCSKMHAHIETCFYVIFKDSLVDLIQNFLRCYPP